MRIEVTREDIQRGKRGDCYSCPLAFAIGRALGVPVEIWSHQVVILSRVDSRYQVVPLPEIARRFVAGYDINKIRPATCPPFSFELDLEQATSIVPSEHAYE